MILKKTGTKVISKEASILLIVVGIAILALGIVMIFRTPDSAHGLSTLSGMCTGIGFVFAVFGIRSSVTRSRLTPEEIHRAKIEANDERNRLLGTKAFTVSSIVSITFCFIAGVVLFILEDVLAGYVFIAGVLIQTISYLFAHKYYGIRY
jgi:hypothetical protein